MFLTQEQKNVVRDSSSEVEEALLNDCPKRAVNYVACVHGSPVLYVTDESAGREEGNSHDDLDVSRPQHKECETSKDDRAGKK